MKNFRVCFYAENSLDISYQVIVRAQSQDSVVERAKEYFMELGLPKEKLLEYTVQLYEQGSIQSVEII